MVEGATDNPTRRGLVALVDEVAKLPDPLTRVVEEKIGVLEPRSETLGDFAPRWITHSATVGTRSHLVEKRLRRLRTSHE